jgi:hypothetical protein
MLRRHLSCGNSCPSQHVFGLSGRGNVGTSNRHAPEHLHSMRGGRTAGSFTLQLGSASKTVTTRLDLCRAGAGLCFGPLAGSPVCRAGRSRNIFIGAWPVPVDDVARKSLAYIAGCSRRSNIGHSLGVSHGGPSAGAHTTGRCTRKVWKSKPFYRSYKKHASFLHSYLKATIVPTFVAPLAGISQASRRTTRHR